MNTLRRALGHLAGGAAVVGGVLVLMSAILVATVGTQEYSELLTRPLLRYAMTLGPNASIRPGHDGDGALGTSALRIGTSYIRNASADTSTSARRILGSTVGGPNGATLMWVHNISGDSILAGDALVYDNAGITVVNAAAYGLTSATIAADLTDETTNGGWLSLVVTVAGTAVDTDTVRIVGKDADGAAQVLRLGLTAGGTSDTWAKSSTARLYWTDIDSVQTLLCDSGVTTVTVTAYGYATVKESDGANTDFAGVCSETIHDNDIGRMVIHGPADCTVDAGTVDATPGVLLELAASGDMVTDAAATTAGNVARAMEYSNLDNTKIRVFIDSF